MAVYSGHAVFPSLYRDMAEPKRYDRMVDTTYLITFVVYLIMAVSGYMMFGLDTMQEVTIRMVYGIMFCNANRLLFSLWC
jgi:vesicular inhibitory amino acid transporter